MSDHDTFERRAASAGAALRVAFLEREPATVDKARASSPAGPPSSGALPGDVRGGSARRPRRQVAAAALVAVAAAAAAVLALTLPDREPADVLAPQPDGRERAVLAPPYLTASGTLPDGEVRSVEAFPVPFTFESPAQEPGARPWRYRVADLVDIGNIESGLVMTAPSRTYDPARPWQGQQPGELVPAPTDADGWGTWLEQTGLVTITERTDLRIGGARATRFGLDLADLPAGYDGCGGGRTCLAITPMLDPQVGTAQVGTGPQVGIDDETAELTVIEVDDRAVLALATTDPGSADRWLPALRAVVESLRFA